MKRIYIILFSFFIVNITYSQVKSHVDKLPWVKGEFPRNSPNGHFKVIKSEGARLSDAQKQADNSLIMDLATQQGVKISMQAINEINSELSTNNNKSSYKETDSNKQISHIKRDDFEAVFSKVDEYYEISGGAYQLWVLYWVSDNKVKTNTPIVAYKTDNGAWRSIIVPGWAQFYTGKTVKGLAFLIGDVALVGAGFYFNNEYNNYNIKAKEAGSVSIKKQYRDLATDNQTYSYIAFGAAAGLYVYNVIDAFVSKSGKVDYDYRKMTVAPITSMGREGEFLAGITIQF